MNRGTTVLTKVMRGITEIQKVIRGTTVIWENWKYYNSSFYAMSSNTAPSPFTASLLTNVTSGSAWNVFDSSDTSNIQNNYKEVSEKVGARINFGQNIRIVRMAVRGSRSGQSVFPITIYGIQTDDVDKLIYSGNVTNNTQVNVNSTDTTTEFKGLKVYGETRADLIVSLGHCIVNQYWKKG
jgi:hypothetical protein